MCWEEQESPHDKMPFAQRGGEPGGGFQAEGAVRRLQAGSLRACSRGTKEASETEAEQREEQGTRPELQLGPGCAGPCRPRHSFAFHWSEMQVA